MSEPEKLFRIGEVMAHTGLSRQTVHNYTAFGLIKEAMRNAAGHRLYEPSVFGRLERVRALKETMTLQEIRELLRREERERAVPDSERPREKRE